VYSSILLIFDSPENFFSLFLISTLYQTQLELSTIILEFLCQEILTKLSGILLSFGTVIAGRTLVHPTIEGAGGAGQAVSPYPPSTYVWLVMLSGGRSTPTPGLNSIFQKLQRELNVWILVGDISLGSSLAIVGRTDQLDNLSINVDLPYFPLTDTRQVGEDIEILSVIFHFSNFPIVKQNQLDFPWPPTGG